MSHRRKLVLEFWDRSRKLTCKNGVYRKFVIQMLSTLMKYDINGGDLTTESLIKKNKNISAVIVAKEDGILAGVEEFSMLNNDLEIVQLKNDGDRIMPGNALAEIRGNAKKILERERTSLNLLQRMSGIATLTNSLNEMLKDNAMLAATRKTPWGLLDKKAVSIGNGLTHRLDLRDGILVKDNHLRLAGYDFEKAINSVKNKSGYIEVEVENKNEALNAAKSIKKLIDRGSKGLFAIMLDKIKPEDIISVTKDLKNMDLYDYILLEASGNITPYNLPEYCGCGVDVISMGFLTNSAKALNMSQEIK